jgi:hypothetical protein
MSEFDNLKNDAEQFMQRDEGSQDQGDQGQGQGGYGQDQQSNY